MKIVSITFIAILLVIAGCDSTLNKMDSTKIRLGESGATETPPPSPDDGEGLGSGSIATGDNFPPKPDGPAPVLDDVRLVNAAADGFINIAESGGSDPVVELTASGYKDASFSIVPVNVNCDSSVSYQLEVEPRASEFSADGDFHVCVRLEGEDGQKTFGGTEPVVVDRMPPHITKLELAGTAADGFVNQTESGNDDPLLDFTASDAHQAGFGLVSPVADCDMDSDYSLPGVPTASSLPSDGVFKICAGVMDEAGNSYTQGSELIVRDTKPPEIIEFKLVGVAADGLINYSENGNTDELVGFSGRNYDSAGFQVLPSGLACDSTRSYSLATMPRIIDLGGEGTYRICLRLADDAGNVAAFGSSGVLVYDTGSPAFVSLELAGAAADGYINASEEFTASPAIILSAENFDFDDFAIIPDATPCDNQVSFILTDIPTVAMVAGTGEGSHRICVRLAKSGANYAYQASDPIIVDTVPPVTPDAITLTPLSPTSLHVDWNAATDAGGGDIEYRIYSSISLGICSVTDALNNGVLRGIVAGDTTEFIVEGIDPPGVEVKINLLAFDESGEIEDYGYQTLDLPDDVTPPVPGMVGAFEITNITSNSAVLSWVPATDDVYPMHKLDYAVYSSTFANVNDVATISTNGALLGVVSGDNSLKVFVGSDQTLYFNILVEDPDGNRAIYTMQSAAIPASGVMDEFQLHGPYVYEFDHVRPGGIRYQAWTVGAGGSRAAPGLNIGIVGNSSFAVEPALSTCDDLADLSKSSQCLITVRYAPQAPGSHYGKLVVSGGNHWDLEILLAGDTIGGPAPILTTDPAGGLDFSGLAGESGVIDPTVLLQGGGAVQRLVQVTNSAKAVSETGISAVLAGEDCAHLAIVPGTDGRDCIGGPAPDLAPGQSCFVTVTFTPESSIGNCKLRIDGDINDPPIELSLAGEVSDNTRVAVSTYAHHFGNVNLGEQSAPMAISVYSASMSAVSIEQFDIPSEGLGDATDQFVFLPGAGGESLPDCRSVGSVSLPATPQCVHTIGFRPDKSGLQTVVLRLSLKSGPTPAEQHLIFLSGNGIGPDFKFAGPNPVFMGYGSNSYEFSKIAHVVNTGTVPMTGPFTPEIVYTPTEGEGFNFLSGCDGALAVGQSCPILLGFGGAMADQYYSADLTVTEMGDNVLRTTGVGIKTFAVSAYTSLRWDKVGGAEYFDNFAGNDIDFGVVESGGLGKVILLTAKNWGFFDDSFSIGFTGSDAAAFKIDETLSNCTAILPPMRECTLAVRFKPTNVATVYDNAQLTVTGMASYNINLGGESP